MDAHLSVVNKQQRELAAGHIVSPATICITIAYLKQWCVVGLCTECGIKHSRKKNYISRERHNVNYSNLQILLPRDITRDSENFIHVITKQKLQLF